METAHKSVLNEIEKSRVNSLYGLQQNFSESSSAKQSKAIGIRAKTHHGVGYKTRNQVHAHDAQSSKKQPSGVSNAEHDLDTKLAALNSRSRSMRSSVNTDEQPEVEKILNGGLLYKTTRGKITSDLTRGQHEHRQRRRFQLTEYSLEYSQLLQRVSSYIS